MAMAKFGRARRRRTRKAQHPHVLRRNEERYTSQTGTYPERRVCLSKERMTKAAARSMAARMMKHPDLAEVRTEYDYVAYRCRYCRRWHVGKQRKETT